MQNPKGTSGWLRTRISAAWTALALGAAVLVVILVFILQNLGNVEVRFLGFSASLPLGVALLFAAVAGALVVLAVGAARILQLRRAMRAADRTQPDAQAISLPDVEGSSVETGSMAETQPKEVTPESTNAQ